MYRDPQGVDGFQKCVVFFVRYHHGCMPPGAPVKHVEYDELMNKEKVTFNLLVEAVSEVNAAGIAWAWFCPLSADRTSVDDLWYDVKDFLWYTDAFQEVLHSVF